MIFNPGSFSGLKLIQFFESDALKLSTNFMSQSGQARARRFINPPEQLLTSFSSSAPGLENVISEQEIFEDSDEMKSERVNLSMANPKNISGHCNEHDSGEPKKGSFSRLSFSRENVYSGLKKYFNFDEFLPNQLEIIQTLLSGRSVVALLPTGSGKSLCYQLAILLHREYQPKKICLVISPLISLMRDQVRNLPSNLPGVVISAKRNLDAVFKKIALGKCGVLFISPEKFSSDDRFFELLNNFEKSCAFVCIDEAHCVSQWGHDFRPCYREICSKLHIFLSSTCPVLSLTATASDHVLRDLEQNFSPSRRIACRTMRPNLEIYIHAIDQNSTLGKKNFIAYQKRLDLLFKLAKTFGKNPVIVYVATQRLAEEVATFLLRKLDSMVSCYHAGLSTKLRSERQTLFSKDKINIMVATLAFGMGIDKSNIRGVIHFSMPSTVEQYIQEIGRGGRDGKIAQCHLILDSETCHEHKKRLCASALDQNGAITLCRRLLHTDKNRKQNMFPYPLALDLPVLAHMTDIEEQYVLRQCYLVQRMAPEYIVLNPSRASKCYLSKRKRKNFSFTKSESTNFEKDSIYMQSDLRNPFSVYISKKLDLAKDKGCIDLFETSAKLNMRYDDLCLRIRETCQGKNFCAHFSCVVPSLVRLKPTNSHTVELIARNLFRFNEDKRRIDIQKLSALYGVLRILSTSEFASSAQDLLNNLLYSSSESPTHKTFSDVKVPFVVQESNHLELIQTLILSSREYELSALQCAKIFYGIPTAKIDIHIRLFRLFWGKLGHLDFDNVIKMCQSVLQTLKTDKKKTIS